jgi:hypothetical protein
MATYDRTWSVAEAATKCKVSVPFRQGNLGPIQGLALYDRSGHLERDGRTYNPVLNVPTCAVERDPAIVVCDHDNGGMR